MLVLNACPFHPGSNQIYLLTLTYGQLTQASFLQKNQMLQNVFFFYISNAEQKLFNIEVIKKCILQKFFNEMFFRMILTFLT